MLPVGRVAENVHDQLLQNRGGGRRLFRREGEFRQQGARLVRTEGGDLDRAIQGSLIFLEEGGKRVDVTGERGSNLEKNRDTVRQLDQFLAFSSLKSPRIDI